MLFKASLLTISTALIPQALAACSPGDLAIGIASSFFIKAVRNIVERSHFLSLNISLVSRRRRLQYFGIAIVTFSITEMEQIYVAVTMVVQLSFAARGMFTLLLLIVCSLKLFLARLLLLHSSLMVLTTAAASRLMKAAAEAEMQLIRSIFAAHHQRHPLREIF